MSTKVTQVDVEDKVTQVGVEDIDNTQKRHRRIFARCSVTTPERGATDTTDSLDEIVLMRLMYRTIGGSVTVTGGLTHSSFANSSVRDYSDQQIADHISRLIETYNGKKIGEVEYNWFTDVYGPPSKSTIVEKMREIVEEIEARLVQSKDCKEHMNGIQIEEFLDRLFPHTARSGIRAGDFISVPDIDAHETPPEIGAKNTQSPPKEKKSTEFKDAEEEAMFKWLSRDDRTDPLTKTQAKRVVFALRSKPVDRFTRQDYKDFGLLFSEDDKELESQMQRVKMGVNAHYASSSHTVAHRGRPAN